jgi:hypothetical protein
MSMSGVRFEKFHRDRQDVHAAKHDRRSDHQVASRIGVFACRGALGFIDVFEDPLAGRDVGTPSIGKRKAAARSINEPRSQMCLEFRDLAADGCEQHPELAGRCR